MAYTITLPVKNQPIPSAGFGIAVRNAILDLDTRVSKLEQNAQSVVARTRRTTSTGTITTTETGVLRIDNIPVKAGNIYQLNTGNINIDTSVANDVGDARIRIAYAAGTGTLATTASAQIGHMRNTIDDISFSNTIPINTFYLATADGYVSIILTLQRMAGSGNLIIFCAGNEILDFVVQFGGADPGDTGVIL